MKHYTHSLYEMTHHLVNGVTSGLSVTACITEYLEDCTDKRYLVVISDWLSANQNGTKSHFYRIHRDLSPNDRYLFTVLDHSLEGASILNVLKELLDDLDSQINDQYTNFLDSLQFKLVIPMMLFVLPAFLIILIGPILKNLITELQL